MAASRLSSVTKYLLKGQLHVSNQLNDFINPKFNQYDQDQLNPKFNPIKNGNQRNKLESRTHNQLRQTKETSLLEIPNEYGGLATHGDLVHDCKVII